MKTTSKIKIPKNDDDSKNYEEHKIDDELKKELYIKNKDDKKNEDESKMNITARMETSPKRSRTQKQK